LFLYPNWALVWILHWISWYTWIAGLWSRSRRLDLETVSRLTNVSSRSRLEKNCQRLGLVSVSANYVSCPRPIFGQIVHATLVKRTQCERTLDAWGSEALTFSYQISALSKSCYYHIRKLLCLRPFIDFNVTIVGNHSHVGSQTLGEVCHRLVDVFLWQLFCRATFNSSVALGFEGICFILPAWRPSSRAGTNLESFNEPGRVRLQPVLYDARNTENLGCLSSLKEHNFVIFRWISTKLCGKVYILPFNSLIVL